MLTSRRFWLLTYVLVDPTSRRWNVTTWGRFDVGTSRRGSHFPALLSITPVCFHSVLFLYHLHLHSPNQSYSDNKMKKYIFNLKNNTKNLRKTRVYYECFRHSSNSWNRKMAELVEIFPNDQLLMLSVQTPWYADIVNYLACEIVPFVFRFQQKRKLRTDCRLYI